MAFVEIRKGNDKRVVSHSSFENFFRSTGWKLAGEIPATSEPIIKKKEEKKLNEIEKEESIQDEWDEVLEDEEVEDDDVEKPLSEMTKREMVEYAEKNGISLAGLSTAAQYRKAIQEYMKEV